MPDRSIMQAQDSEATRADAVIDGRTQSEEKARNENDDNRDHNTIKEEEDDGSVRIRGFQWALVAISTVSGVFLYALDDTIVADVQPSIIRTLGEIQKLPWISVALRLGATSTNLVWGRLFSTCDVKLLFLTSVVLFEAGLAICGAAPVLNALIVGRVISGIGGVGIYIGALNILSVFTTIEKRPLYISFISIAHCIGILLGPVIGGGFSSSKAGWRWAFYINLCLAAALAPAYLFALPRFTYAKGSSVRERLRRLDFLGAVLSIGGSVALVMALTFGGIVWDFGSGRFIATFCCGIILLFAFAAQQMLCLFTTPHTRLFPVELLQDYEQWIFFVQTAAVTAPSFIPVYFIPLYFQFVRGDSPLEAGVRLLPYIAVGATVILANGFFMGKTGYYYLWFLVGSALVIVGSALMRTLTFHSATSLAYGYSVILAAGTGCFTQASFAAAQTRVRPEQIPSVLSFLGISQLLGMALTFAVGYSLFFNQSAARITDILPNEPRDAVQDAISGVNSELLHSLSASQRQSVLEAISTSISDVYDMVLATSVICFILATVMRKDRAFGRGH